MKAVKELQHIFTAILVLNSAMEQPSAEIDALCEYVFSHCFEVPTTVIRRATKGFKYESVVKQVETLLTAKTKYRKGKSNGKAAKEGV